MSRAIGRVARGVRRRIAAVIDPTPGTRSAGRGTRARTAGPGVASRPAAVRRDPDRDARPSLVVLLPHLAADRMTGGPNTAFQVTERLRARGMAVRYVACSGPVDPAPTLVRHLLELTGVTDGPDATFEDAASAGSVLEVGRDDVLLATWWRTATLASHALPCTRMGEFLYLVQDYEPAFYPWSSNFALAASTYAMPIRAIVNEDSLLAYLREATPPSSPIRRPGMAIAFTPTVDRSVFAPRAVTERTTCRLAFYARPNHPRNLYEIGLGALREAARSGVFDTQPWELVAIGEAIKEVPLSGRHVLRPAPWLAYGDYAAFLAGSDVLLSLMLSPHTSYPPLEMAATGGRVVTNTFATKTAEMFQRVSPLIHAVPPDVASVATAVGAAVDAVSRPATGPEALALPASWDMALGEVLPWIEAAVAGIRSSPVDRDG